MALQRFGGGLAWLALVAVSLFLLQPDLFPDIRLPAALDGLLDAPNARLLIGSMAGLVAAAIGAGGAMEIFRGGRRRDSSLAYAGPMLEAEPAPKRAAPAPSATPALKAVEPVGAPSAAPVPTPLEIVVTPGHKAMAEALRAGDAARDGGGADAALEHYSAAVEMARGLHAAAPNDPGAKAQLAQALSRLAIQEEAQGRIDPALSLFEESVELRRALAAAAPDSPEPSEALAAALAELADCREARGHASRARDHFAEAVGISERLSWLEPESESRRAVLAAHKARLDALQAELSSNDP